LTISPVNDYEKRKMQLAIFNYSPVQVCIFDLKITVELRMGLGLG